MGEWMGEWMGANAVLRRLALNNATGLESPVQHLGAGSQVVAASLQSLFV